ncbi:hypothetical protein [Staphylospora marina]|uniref:hypothetical protein n=1 Tax=Staphylospora marina TaxID=2490858 RepID=UPI000F5C14B4|nr:hypothetical protein [Staphylospora marina]
MQEKRQKIMNAVVMLFLVMATLGVLHWFAQQQESAGVNGQVGSEEMIRQYLEQTDPFVKKLTANDVTVEEAEKALQELSSLSVPDELKTCHEKTVSLAKNHAARNKGTNNDAKSRIADDLHAQAAEVEQCRTQALQASSDH